MATVDITNWSRKKNIDGDINATSPGSEKVQPIILDGGDSEGKTGNGNIGYNTSDIDTSTTATKRESIVLTDSDELTTKEYWIENPEDLGTTTEVTIWVYDPSYATDGSTQIVLGLGTGDGTDYSAEGTGSNPWTQTGVNALGIYYLNETSGSTIDYSGNNNDSINTSSTTYDVTGQFNSARLFDGDDNIEFDIDFAGRSNASMVGYINSDNVNTVGVQMYQGGSGNDIFGTDHLDDSNNNVIRAAINGINLSGSSLSENTWYQVGVSYDGGAGTAELILDGLVDDSTTGADSSLNSSTSNSVIGARDDESRGFIGTIDAVRWYSDTKSQTWYQADYEASPVAGQVFFSQQAAEDTTTGESFTRNPTETVGVADTVAVDKTFVRDLAEQINVSDTAATALNPPLAPVTQDGFEDGDFTTNPEWTANGTGILEQDVYNSVGNNAGTFSWTTTLSVNTEAIISVTGFELDASNESTVTIEIEDSSNNVLASKQVTVSGNDWKTINWTESDYSRIPNNETLNVNYSISGGDGNALEQNTSDSYSGNLFSFSSEPVPAEQDSNGGTVFKVTKSSEPLVQTNTVKNGTYATQLPSTTSLNLDRAASTSISDGDVFQTWIRFDADPNNLYNGYSIKNSGKNDMVSLYYNAGQLDYATFDGSGNVMGNNVVSGATSISLDTWYLLEIEYDTANSNVDLRVFDSNQSLVGESTGINYSGATNYSTIRVGESGNAATVYADDVSYKSQVPAITRAVSEQINIDETYSRVVDAFRSSAEDVLLSDQLTKVATFIEALNEQVSIADNLDFRLFRTLTENISVSDVIAEDAELFRSYTEGVAVDGTFTKVAKIDRLNEQIGVAYQYSRDADYFRNYTEVVGSNEVYSRVGEFFRSYNEGVILDDVVAAVIKKFRTFTEGISIDGTFTKVAKIDRLNEQVGVNEVYSRDADFFRDYTEGVSIDDQRIFYLARALSEQLRVNDFINIIKIVKRDFSESVLLSDQSDEVFMPSRTYTEVIGMDDDFTKAGEKTRFLDEAVSVSDTFEKSLAKSYTNIVSVDDTYSREIEAVRALNEGSKIRDSYNRELEAFRDAVSEVVLIEDTPETLRQSVRKIQESISVADQFDRFFREGPGTAPYYANFTVYLQNTVDISYGSRN